MLVGVIDLLAGQAVHAIAGVRDSYQALDLRQYTGTETLPGDYQPGDVAALVHFYRHRGVSRFYVADLDALQGGANQTHALDVLASLARDWIIDAGLGGVATVCRLRQAYPGKRIAPILATEWIESPSVAAKLLTEASDLDPWLSVDFTGERLWNAGPGWYPDEPERFWPMLEKLDVRRWILLNVTGVGKQSGLANLTHLRGLRERDPGCQILVGGGVRDADDRAAAITAGADGILSATAILNGRLSNSSLEDFE